MQASIELDEGRKKLQEILDEFPAESSHWNEAQNRFQFIDRLLIECLGWQRPDIRVEESDELGGKSDYHLGHPAKAILEAKREAKTFGDLPSGNPTALRKIQPLIQASRNFRDAAAQVIPYCAINGATIAVVCNGPQLALFQAVIPGSPPLEGECYFFNGFDAYIEHFPLLWKILSPEGISENCAYRDLSLHRNPRIPAKASEFIAEPNKYRYRNDFQENLRSLSSFLLEEIEDSPELKHDFYRECYVTNEANNRNLLLSKKIIASRYARVSDSSVQPSSLDLSASDTDGGGLESKESELLSAAGSRPIVVIGDVGVGKTSFFENLFESLDKNEKSQTIFLHINLGIKANLTDELKAFVRLEIPDILKNKYGIDIFDAEFVNSLYYRDIEQFDKSIQGQLKSVNEAEYELAKIKFLTERTEDFERHLLASLGYLSRGQNKQIILVLDNADQRTYKIQQETFLIAQELAASRNLIVFVALRPSTFFVSKESGALSAYQNKLLTISPPPADEVVQRRLIFALNVAEGQITARNLDGIRLNLGNVVLFLKATLRSIRSNDSIQRFLSNISGGNTRAVIELITSFFGSPNVEARKIVRLEEAKGNYKIPLHEFTKHALLGEYAYYNSQSSFLACNVFDISLSDPREHFLSTLIIAFLTSTNSASDSDGFYQGQDILVDMVKNGFIEEQVRNSLRLLAAKRLIETPHAHFREIPVADHEPAENYHFRATSIGIYHIRYWIGNFAFLDAVSIDTPIFDESAREEISKLASSFSIEQRYARSTIFRKYLEEQWYAASFSANYYDFVSVIRSQQNSFDSVKRHIDNTNYPRKKR